MLRIIRQFFVFFFLKTLETKATVIAIKHKFSFKADP